MSKRPSDINGNDLYDFDLFGPGSSSFEGWSVFGDGIKEIDMEAYRAFRDGKLPCEHEWEEYIGFNSRDYTCTKCKERRDTI
jgi:hypothetical protein